MIVGAVLWGRSFSFQTLFLNVTFLFGLVPGEHESLVMAGWLIGIEMLFYLLFPIFAVLLPTTRSAIIGFLVAYVLASAVRRSFDAQGLGTFVYMNLLNHLPFFLAGFLCFRIWQSCGLKQQGVGWLLFGLSIMLAVVFVSRPTHEFLAALPSGIAAQKVWAIVFSLLLLSACLVSNPILEKGPLRLFGKLSYSMYLLHPLVLVALIKGDALVHLQKLGLGTTADFFIASMVTIALVTAISAFTYRFIESPGIRLGRKVATQISDGSGVLVAFRSAFATGRKQHPAIEPVH